MLEDQNETASGDQGTSQEPFDIGSILGTGTSGQSPETTGLTGQPNANGGSESAAPQQYKFGGRTYASQKAAEDAHNKLYGKYSEQQSLLNQMKEALKNPQMLSRFRGDPAAERILAKLGVEAAQEEAEAARQAGGQEQDLPPQLQKYMEEWNTERAVTQLEREEWAFERELGRPITRDERNAVLDIIAKHESLDYSDAWKLAFHGKLLKEAAAKNAAAKATGGQRPPPRALNVPGVKIDTKKSIESMSNAEFREAMREELHKHG